RRVSHARARTIPRTVHRQSCGLLASPHALGLSSAVRRVAYQSAAPRLRAAHKTGFMPEGVSVHASSAGFAGATCRCLGQLSEGAIAAPSDYERGAKPPSESYRGFLFET